MKTKKIIISYFYMVLAKQKNGMVPNDMSKLNPNASFISDSKSFI